VSRLGYAPKRKDIQVTDIKAGTGMFVPKTDKPVSFVALKSELKKAGYVLASAAIKLDGKLLREEGNWQVVTPTQSFLFANSDAVLFKDAVAGELVEVVGDWIDPEKKPLELIYATELKRLKSAALLHPMIMSFTGETGAPIRVTSPGLTVYKGGAVVPRVFLIKQHFGDIEVRRQVLDLSVSYTPSPRMQLEVDVPVSRTSFDDGVLSDSRAGLGNVTVWTKYRFFRKVKTYGDRQAAFRFGLELPTGSEDAPAVNAPDFVKQQLTPISGGLSPHFNISFSQAGGRLIVGGDGEAIVRGERNGFRMGHEVRVSTDSEYVLLPRKYDAPGRELFLILETTFVHRSNGKLEGATVAGSKSTEYYLAPGLQYAAAPQLVLEGSYQFPLIRNTGPLVLRNDQNILLGVRYLF
jgi:outer membrane putative beta-barrel porin/alpha-amylase